MLDLLRVFSEPAMVFDRVREQPRVLAPATALVVLAFGVAVALRPFYQAGTALGLDLLYDGDSPFLGALLNSVNPFSVYGVWLAGLGVAVTHRTSRATGYTAAAISYLVGSLVLSAFASLQGGGARN